MTSNFQLQTSNSSRSEPAFTLLEVILAMSIMAIISVTSFGIIRGTISATTEMQAFELEETGLHTTIELCRRSLTSLPNGSEVTLSITEPGDPPLQELIFKGHPEAFGFGPSAVSYEETTLGLLPATSPTGDTLTDSEGRLLYDLALSREDLIPEEDQGLTIEHNGRTTLAPDDQGRYWLPLLRNIVSLRWRFWRAEEDLWIEEWDSADLPPMIELEITQANRTTPTRTIIRPPEF